MPTHAGLTLTKVQYDVTSLVRLAPLGSYPVAGGSRYEGAVRNAPHCASVSAMAGYASSSKRWILKSPLYSGLESLLLENSGRYPRHDALQRGDHRVWSEVAGMLLPPFTDLKPDPPGYVQGVKDATDLHMTWRASQPALIFDIRSLPVSTHQSSLLDRSISTRA